MGDSEQLTQLQKALNELQGAVEGLSSADGFRKEAAAPAAQPVGQPADPQNVPAPPGPRADVEAAGLTKAVAQLSANTASVTKAVSKLIRKQEEEDKKKEDLAKARLARVSKLRRERVEKQAKEEDDDKLQKMINKAIAKALGKPEPEEEDLEKQEEEEKSPYPKAVAKQEGASVSSVGHAKQKGEGDELTRAETQLGKAYEEELGKLTEDEELEKLTEEEEEVEKALKAALAADEEEEVEKQEEEEIPEELKKLLASRGFGLSGDFNPAAQVDKARLLKSMGYRPVPVTQGLPMDSRSAGRGDGSTLGDVVDRVKGMGWSQLNELRSELGAW